MLAPLPLALCLREKRRLEDAHELLLAAFHHQLALLVLRAAKARGGAGVSATRKSGWPLPRAQPSRTSPRRRQAQAPRAVALPSPRAGGAASRRGASRAAGKRKRPASSAQRATRAAPRAAHRSCSAESGGVISDTRSQHLAASVPFCARWRVRPRTETRYGSFSRVWARGERTASSHCTTTSFTAPVIAADGSGVAQPCWAKQFYTGSEAHGVSVCAYAHASKPKQHAPAARRR